jgi:uncharacterized damage-inducible protein DinB
MLQDMVAEIQQEAVTTRKVLERMPQDRLTWQPHEKSMTLGQLGMHIATIPGSISGLAKLDGFDAANANFTPPQPVSVEEVIGALNVSVAQACAFVESLTPEQAAAPWCLSAGGKEVFTIPRVAMMRSIMLNHWYHHRGQLSVYLRLLDVPIPVIYGRSADESPFG